MISEHILIILGGTFVSYLIGSIPFGFILTKIFVRKDIRSIGSGNIGATNAVRAGGKVLGFFVFLFDGLKGVIPTIVGLAIDDFTAILFPVAALLGHVFSIFLGFKGGKGVATSVFILAVLSYQAAAVFVVVWIAVLLITRYVSLASIIASLSSYGFAYLMAVKMSHMISIQAMVFITTSTCLILLKHIKNMHRIISGTEFKVFSSGNSYR